MNALSNIVLISGTDTGIGKTWVGCRLAEAAREANLSVLALKVVETGTTLIPNGSEDGQLLARAAGQSAPTMALRRYRTPIAAAAAADREGIPLDLHAVAAEAQAYAATAQLTLLEGAGGLLAPLTWSHSLVHLAQWLRAPVLIVAADRLGTINHTLLALHALDSASVRCAGVIMNSIGADASDASIGLNAEALAKLRPDVTIVTTDSPDWAKQGLAMLVS